MLIISYVFIKKFILYSISFQTHWTIYFNIHCNHSTTYFCCAQLPARVAYLFFADTCTRSVPIFMYATYLFYFSFSFYFRRFRKKRKFYTQIALSGIVNCQWHFFAIGQYFVYPRNCSATMNDK